ncbi:MAG: hypothetical protein KAI50_11690 [Desulfobacterales bacterium]|nr:hypothetical protein [Desulfobacterales bacterium]
MTAQIETVTNKKKAEDETRSLNNYVVTILIKHLENQGIDRRKEKPKK